MTNIHQYLCSFFITTYPTSQLKLCYLMLAKRRDKACADLHDHGMRTKMAADVGCDISPLPGRCLLMICAVSEALVMLEWIRTSYLIPNAASRWPVNSACSRPGSGKTIVTGMKGQSKTMYNLTEPLSWWNTPDWNYNPDQYAVNRLGDMRRGKDLTEWGSFLCHYSHSGCTGSAWWGECCA